MRRGPFTGSSSWWAGIRSAVNLLDVELVVIGGGMVEKSVRISPIGSVPQPGSIRAPASSPASTGSGRSWAELLADNGGDLSLLRSVARPGWPPTPAWHLSRVTQGRVRGNLHRPKRYHRGLRRVFYLAAPSAINARTGPRASTTSANEPKAGGMSKP